MFYSTVVNETAHLIAQWMSVGFAHGKNQLNISSPFVPTSTYIYFVSSWQVCVTQTISASCLSPSTMDHLASWSRMTPVCTIMHICVSSKYLSVCVLLKLKQTFNVADFVPNTSDDEGRYSIGAQVNVGLFNLEKLLVALSPVLTHKQQKEWENHDILYICIQG